MPTLRLVALTLACTFAVAVAVAVGSAQASPLHHCPSAAKRAFTRGCTKTGSKAVCARALRCVQGKLSYRSFIRAGLAIRAGHTTKGVRIVRACGREAVRG